MTSGSISAFVSALFASSSFFLPQWDLPLHYPVCLAHSLLHLILLNILLLL